MESDKILTFTYSVANNALKYLCSFELGNTVYKLSSFQCRVFFSLSFKNIYPLFSEKLPRTLFCLNDSQKSS